VKIPRDCDGAGLTRTLRRLGYEMQRQTGSHMQLTTRVGGEHHLSVPNHRPLKVGMLNALLKDVAAHHGLDIEALLKEISI